MTDIEERFAGNRNDGSLIERQLFRRVSCPSGSRALTVETATNVKTYGRGAGVGRGLGVGLGRGVALGVPMGVAVGVAVAVAVGVGVGV